MRSHMYGFRLRVTVTRSVGASRRHAGWRRAQLCDSSVSLAISQSFTLRQPALGSISRVHPWPPTVERIRSSSLGANSLAMTLRHALFSLSIVLSRSFVRCWLAGSFSSLKPS